MNDHSTTFREVDLASTIHLEFIQNLADHSGEEALQAVEAYHRALFMHRHGQDLQRYQQQRQFLEERLAHLTPRWHQAREELTRLKPLLSPDPAPLPDRHPSSPWHAWDIAMFVASLAGIVALLVFGILNVSFNLLESGLVTFLEHPVRAYFWAALLPVGALAVKVGWDLLPGSRLRHGYLWSCLLVGLVAVLVWVVAYASVYPTLSQSTEEQIAALSVVASPSAGTGLASVQAKRIDTIIVSAQALAEIFLSAVLGMYMTGLYQKHRRIRLPASPGFAQWEQERHRLEKEINEARLTLAEAQGQEEQLLHQLSVLLAFAKSLYEKEASRRQDRGYQKRMLLERITEDFKARLESVENDPAFAEDTTAAHLALRPQVQP